MSGDKAFTVTCPTPKRSRDKILLAHGSGGKFTSELLEEIFFPAFNCQARTNHDGACLSIGGERLAFTTDSYVVQPLFFPGGNIGDLAACGTINDLAMCGAKPLYLSCAVILEEGFPTEELCQIVQSMARVAAAVGAKFVTGDTKVIEKGRGDGCYINTSGIGRIVREAGPQHIQPGDSILISGDIGRHGMAVLSEREGLSFDSVIESDTAELWSLVNELLSEGISLHCLRDLTRGGLATALVELAESCQLGAEIDESRIAMQDPVRGACEFLGLDPFYVACEGRMIAFVPQDQVAKALDIMKSHNSCATEVGQVADQGPAMVFAKTFLGTKRRLDRLPGDQLPRIC